ncbi:MAG: ATP-binding protein [Oculatellaceae cyanobacterium Prado106]|jgi:PAS domain S-box-containing protein|nr:ATP-binding protein [Oculatellaceae cyanobacterium Prado106]
MTARAIASKLQGFLSSRLRSGESIRLSHYAIALLSPLAALGITLLFHPLLQNTPSALFYVAVMVSSWIGGLGAGLLATLLSTIKLNYFLLEPRYAFDFTDRQILFSLGIFTVAAFAISYLNASRLDAKRQADANLKALLDSEARFNHLAEANIIGILEANLNGSVIAANDAFLHMIGYSREDLLAGRIRWDEMTPPEYQAVSQRSQQQLRTVGFCTPFEKEYICKDGSRVPILLGSAMRDGQSVIGFVLDRSESKRYEAEREQLLNQLETSLGQLEAVINNLTEGLIIADRQGQILTFNPVALAQHGYDSLDQVQQHLHEVSETIEVHDLQGNFVPLEQWPISRALRGETFLDCEIQVHRRDRGTTFIGSYGGTAVRDKHGRVTLGIVTVRDVTQQRQAQAELARSLLAEQTAREESEQANRVKDEFLAVLSHELRSPLNPILGWAQLLQSQQFDAEKTAHALSTIERNAQLQAQLIDDLLDVSRILQGKFVVNLNPVNLVTVVEAAIEVVRLSAEAKGIQLHTVFPSDRMVVMGDASRLQQVVWNLLTNAVKFTPRGGTVEIRLDSHGNMAQIQIQDTGKGISPEFLPHVFDYFRQEDGATTRKFGGLGLGLALVRHLIEQQGGEVRVESAGENQGATFTVRLPLQSRPQSDQNPIASASALKLQSELQGTKVLVVDDEPDMRDLMLTVVKAYGAEVMAIATASEALSLLVSWQPDILVSDIGMPEMDGYMLIRQVRSRAPDQGGLIPAIALTAYAGEMDQQQALAAGFQRHLAKPIEPEQFVKAIIQVLEESQRILVV